MVLTRGVHVGTLFHLDGCTIRSNLSSIFVAKISIEALVSKSNYL